MKLKTNNFIHSKILTTGLVTSMGLLGLSTLSSCEQEEDKKPNIIFIYTDQQQADMMSCAGNRWLETPGMDYIAENGIRFTKAYTTIPVSAPARVSLMTGRFPGTFTDNNGNVVRDNSSASQIPEISDEVKNTNIAASMQKAGYKLLYGGKKHLPDPLLPSKLGFNVITDNRREKLPEVAAEYIKKEHDQPYFMWLNPINPHDICYMAIQKRTFENPAKDTARNYQHENKLAEEALAEALKLPDGVSEEEFFAKYAPPLPPNFEPQEGEPQAIKNLLKQRPFRMWARKNYTKKDWRFHRWAYCRLTERVDKQVQTVIEAVKESGQEKNTLIIFSSDHGDMDGAHRMEHKTALYEEAANIPFMAMWKGHIPEGQVDSTHLVSNALDLLPTISDYAGIKGFTDSIDIKGRSLRPLFEGRDVTWRKTLGVESEIGRMIVDEEGYKYIQYDFQNLKEEQLLDLNKDPYETTHFTNNSAYESKLEDLRESFAKWFDESK